MCYCARGMRGAAPWYHALARTLARGTPAVYKPSCI